MFDGTISITSDAKACFEISQTIPNTRILSLDEDNSFIELSPDNNSSVIMATILLPPTEVVWAWVDGNVQLYNELYYTHLSTKPIADFITTIFGYIYFGGNIIIYAPEYDASGLEMGDHISFILNYLNTVYGLSIIKTGTPIDNFYCNISFIPKHLLALYAMNIITGYSFLTDYPLEAVIPEEIYYKLILDLYIYGANLQEKILSVSELRLSLHRNNKIIQGLISII